MSVIWIYANKEAASDESLLIVSFESEDGASVDSGDILLEVEGSKSLFEIRAEVSGVVYHFSKVGDQIPVGDIISCICTNGEQRPVEAPKNTETLMKKNKKQEQLGESDLRFSDSAKALLIEFSLDSDSVLPDLEFVTESDIKEFLQIKNLVVSKKSNIRKIAILGGGYGATLAFEIIGSNPIQNLVGVFDDNQNLLLQHGVERLAGLDLPKIVTDFKAGVFDEVAIMVQSNKKLRQELHEFCVLNEIPLVTLVHPRASVSPTAIIEPGCLIMDNVRVGYDAHLKRNVFVSGTVNIDHHCVIGENTTFGPGVFLSGGVDVGSNCSFGTSIGVESEIKIGNNCVITSGSIIQSNIADDTVVKSVGGIVKRR